MASNEQGSGIIEDRSPSEVLEYILQPIRDYDKDESLMGVVEWLLAVQNLNARSAGEVLKRAIEARQKLDSE